MGRGMVVERDAAGKPLRMIGTNSDITQRRQAEAMVSRLAYHDSLTQLPNRRLLVDRMSQAMSASKRSGNYGALMVLDLDNFKPLNDAYVHFAGDLLLNEAATGQINRYQAFAQNAGLTFEFWPAEGRSA